MLPDKSNPLWPDVAIVALRGAQEKSPDGCGGCAHAEWLSDAVKNAKGEDEFEFTVGRCRQGMYLPNADGRNIAAVFCTMWNGPASPSGTKAVGIPEVGRQTPAPTLKPMPSTTPRGRI
jgi:hypothetical protein